MLVNVLLWVLTALLLHHSADYMQGTYLKFRTREDAVHFW